ncbi:uncharacterized protein E6C27_scaffold139G004460 [Cucumis melo var. makuwa]|uniref:Uncharacterized protein n=1 Tax=Cucumis melo var. makuwa TaxID=1194695 RepID=A0A5A7SNS2_CUCMM|nr:uncharacterized protein E6C27_scaffold139G004460 [Cucumis melo var. makuwa]
MVRSFLASQGSLKVKRHDLILTNLEKEDSKQREGEISCHHITILEELEIEIPEEDAEDVPQSLEDGGQSIVDELKEVNLDTMEEPCPTFISASLSSEKESKYMSLLTEYKDIFASSYKEMSGLNPKIEVEVNKLIEAGFIREVKYPTWITNIVPIRKKNGQLHICVDFCDLNNLEKEDSKQREGEISCHHITILEELEIEIPEEDAEDVPQSLEDGGQSIVDELKEVNLDTMEEPCPTFISASLSSEKESKYMSLLTEYKDIFASSYKEMSGLNPKIEVEVNKLIEAGFIREVKYPTWITNIVPIRKKNGQLHICVDFCDLNNACPKDDFPLPITEIMVDVTTGHEALSFMDGSSGYNQIQMALSDEEVTFFRTPKGIYCYKMMPFGLKNVVPLIDVLCKKCLTICNIRKFLGFIVRHRRIEINQSKIDAIQKMPRPKSLHDLRSLQGRLAYTRRFISNLAGRCQPFQKLMRKGENFVWDEACQNAFDSINKYLLNPPVLGAPIPGKPLILYIAAQERSLGALLAQEKEKGKEHSLYYLSRTLVGAEVNYSSIKKMCLALFFVIDKLRHYMQAFTVHLVAKADPIKYVLSRPIISGRLAKWAILLQQYDIVYISQKAIKGQALTDLLADHPIPSYWKLCEDLPDDEVFFTEVMEPWTMYFDGTVRRSGAGAGIILNSPEKYMLPYSFALAELCSNNVAECQALTIGLQMALEIGVSLIEIYDDLKLIINQLSLQYDVKHEDLKPYFTYARQLMERLDSVMLEHVPRIENKRADALVNLATALVMPDNVALNIPLCQRWIMPPILPECQEANVTTSHLIDEEDWRQPIIEYLEHGKLPKDSRHKTKPLHPTVASWSFEAWGLDLVGPITLKSSAGHSYILAATDYFSKWAEAIPLREAKKENVANFIRNHIIYRYGIPHWIMTDNGSKFSNSMIDKLCEKFKFKQYKSSMYNAAANGLGEAFNKTLCNLLKKIVSKSKRDWQERIDEALVEALDEERLEAQQALECYQARMSKAFDKHVKPRSFLVGELVLAIRRPIITTRHTGNKFTSKWDGPYIVKEVYTNGAYKIVDRDKLKIGPINGKFLKNFYA